MKTNELMIGDWVLAYGKKTQIVWVGNIRKLAVRGFPSEFYEDEISPIPLTPEILEKNEFTKELDADGLHYRFTLIDGHTKFSILNARRVFQWLGPLDFKYVHELQHALRLCGIKKEIEL